MLCPVCKNVQLVMSEKKNVEIDYCPQCRGVWLDRGEIDKIIERSLAEDRPIQPQSNYPGPNPAMRQERHRDQRDHYEHQKHYEQKHYKKKSIWHELFD